MLLHLKIYWSVVAKTWPDAWEMKMQREVKVGLLVVLALAGVGVFLVAARTINTTPGQCASCHGPLSWRQAEQVPRSRRRHRRRSRVVRAQGC